MRKIKDKIFHEIKFLVGGKPSFMGMFETIIHQSYCLPPKGYHFDFQTIRSNEVMKIYHGL
jgi:hypothetical protein